MVELCNRFEAVTVFALDQNRQGDLGRNNHEGKAERILPGKSVSSVEMETAFQGGITENVRPMGNNAEIAEHGTTFLEQLLVPEDTKDLERVVKVHQGVEEQYKYAALQAQRGHQGH